MADFPQGGIRLPMRTNRLRQLWKDGKAAVNAGNAAHFSEGGFRLITTVNDTALLRAAARDALDLARNSLG